MSSRLPGRLSTLRRYLLSAAWLRRRQRPQQVKRILVLHHLLLGDTLMLTPLLARLREQHPAAEILMTMAPPFVPLYAGQPYGVQALAFDPRNPATVRALLKAGPFDLAYLPGDSRYGLLAQAMGARWVVAFAGDRPAWKKLWCDELLPLPDRLTNEADVFTWLAGPGPWPGRFDPERWSLPAGVMPLDLPAAPYAVLHLGAGNLMRQWPGSRWRALAERLTAQGLNVVWSAGKNELDLVRDADPEGRYANVAGRLDLPGMARLLRGARLLVCLDSGICHLAKHARTPTVTLYGPGNPDLFGPGDFWAESPMADVFQRDFPCRDQNTLFKRPLPWVVRCGRTLHTCVRVQSADGQPVSACMNGIGVEQVMGVIGRLLGTV